MQLNELLVLPDHRFAEWLRSIDPAVAVAIPVNGTRRWWRLSRGGRPALPNPVDELNAYLLAAQDQLLATQRLILEHGVAAIITPVMGGRLIARRDAAYAQAVFSSLKLLVRPEVLEFYRAIGTRMCFYGDYPRVLSENGAGDLLPQLEQAVAQTAGNGNRLVLYGLWAHDTVTAATSCAIAFYQAHGRAPSREDLIEAYYGTPVPLPRIYIGVGKTKVYDIPLLESRRMSLYYAAAPTLDLKAGTLRAMLFDTLVARLAKEQDALKLSADEFDRLQRYVNLNADHVAGLGDFDEELGFWTPQGVSIP
jgi:hypothetical protein